MGKYYGKELIWSWSALLCSSCSFSMLIWSYFYFIFLVLLIQSLLACLECDMAVGTEVSLLLVLMTALSITHLVNAPNSSLSWEYCNSFLWSDSIELRSCQPFSLSSFWTSIQCFLWFKCVFELASILNCDYVVCCLCELTTIEQAAWVPACVVDKNN